MIKNIIFDMGGVLIDYNPRKNLEPYFSEETTNIALREIFKNPLWAEKDRGTVTAEEIWEQKKDFIPSEAIPMVKDMTFNLYPYMKPFPQMVGLISGLKKEGYGIFLLSNASADFYENKINIPALALFDGYLISADYLLLKPEKAIYEKLFTKFNLNPKECVFIDDVPDNVKGSIAAGMPAICYSHGDIELLKSDLRNMGVRV